MMSHMNKGHEWDCFDYVVMKMQYIMDYNGHGTYQECPTQNKKKWSI